MPSQDRAKLVVCPVEDLPPGAFKVVETERGRSIAIYNVRGEYRAIGSVCPHQGGPLAVGPATGTTRAGRKADGQFTPEWTSDGDIVRCGWHLWEFELKTGKALADEKMRVLTYPVSVVRDESASGKAAAMIVVEV